MKKKFYLMMAVVMMLSVVLVSEAFAGSDTVSGTIPGTSYACTGTAYCYDRTTSCASAQLYFSGPTAGGLRIQLEYDYTLLGVDCDKTSTVSRDGFSLSTSLNKFWSDEVPVRALALFYVDYGQRWDDIACATP